MNLSPGVPHLRAPWHLVVKGTEPFPLGGSTACCNAGQLVPIQRRAWKGSSQKSAPTREERSQVAVPRGGGMRNARLVSKLTVPPRKARAHTRRGAGSQCHRDSRLCYHARLRVGRYIWRGRRPTRGNRWTRKFACRIPHSSGPTPMGIAGADLLPGGIIPTSS
jgi:hypothetical protein